MCHVDHEISKIHRKILSTEPQHALLRRRATFFQLNICLTFAPAAAGRQLHLCDWVRHLPAVVAKQVLLRFHSGFRLDAAAGTLHRCAV